MKKPIRSRRGFKQKVLNLIRAENLDRSLENLLQLPASQVINSLFAFLPSTDELTKWRAVTAMGQVVERLADKDMESARVIMRRLMWSLNDESGGIGWGAAEAMGEIIACHDGIAREYLNVLISYVREGGNQLEYAPMQRGALWAIGRVAQARPEIVKDAASQLVAYLDSSDVTVRGMAAWTIGLLGTENAAVNTKLESLLNDEVVIQIYIDRTLVRRRVNEVVREALDSVRRVSN